MPDGSPAQTWTTAEPDPVASHRSSFATHWDLDPSISFLNHGSFGLCPRVVLGAQAEWRRRIEVEPVRFLDRELEGHLDAARDELGALVGARRENLAFVSNATTGVNAVLSSIRFRPGDELLTTDHEYNAALNTLRAAAARDGARVVVARIPFPISSPGEVIDALVGAVTPRTRLALVSHITSPTALVFPIGEIVRELDRRGVDVLVDGAHAPGQVPLDLEALGAPFYTGNGHKWLCGPIGSGFLHVREDRRSAIHPLVTSHGANSVRRDRSRFQLEFDWPGTVDPTPFLALVDSIRFMASLVPGGWPAIMATNHRLALRGRDILTDALEVAPPAPDAMLGAMAAIPLPHALGTGALGTGALGAAGRAASAEGASLPDPGGRDPIMVTLFDRFRIEVPVIAWPVPAALEPDSAARARVLRISAALYNDETEYRSLAGALRSIAG